jgi:hypothetical protein
MRAMLHLSAEDHNAAALRARWIYIGIAYLALVAAVI